MILEKRKSATTKVIAIIPARGGSKGLPRKNVRILQGKPLIAYSIEAALNAHCVDLVCVSTEDAEISTVARECGATVIERPAELAIDTAQNDKVVLHALEKIGADKVVDLVVLLQPTSPLRRADHIDACLAPLLAGDVRSVMSIARVDHHPGKSVVLEDGMVGPFTCLEDMEARRQDMLEVYRQNGAIYALWVHEFIKYGRFFIQPCAGYLMDRDDSIDIDGELDIALAELILQSG